MSGTLSSWSRRRAAVAKEAEAEKLAAEEANIAKQHAELAEKSDAEILEELGLPDPDSLVKGDDFKAFMSKAVPQHLRKRALRKLWRSDPVLACVDGLNDYDDDYLTGSTGQGVLKTTYAVGKGLLAHVREMERIEALKTAVFETVGKDDAAAEPAVEETTEEEPVEDVRASASEARREAPAAEPDAPAAAPRRMQFQFEEGPA